MTSTILHHSKKVTLHRDSVHWDDIPRADREFLTDVVDTCGGELSTNKWKKLFAVLAQLAQTTSVNFRVYRSPEGLDYDITSHEVFQAGGPRGKELLHQDAVAAIKAEGGQELAAVKALQFEIRQIDLKLHRLTDKRAELMAQYEEARTELVEGLEI
jgi:hypothetical protein